MTGIIQVSCWECDGKGYKERKCCEREDMRPITHPLNAADYKGPGLSRQGYQVYECIRCGDLWGCRYQRHGGTGSDDRWAKLDPVNPVRHY